MVLALALTFNEFNKAAVETSVVEAVFGFNEFNRTAAEVFVVAEETVLELNEFNRAAAAEIFAAEVVLEFNELSKAAAEALDAEDEDNKEAFKRADVKLVLALVFDVVEANAEVLLVVLAVVAEVLRLEAASLRSFSNAFDVDNVEEAIFVLVLAFVEVNEFNVVESDDLVEFNLDIVLVFVLVLVFAFTDAAANAEVIDIE